MQSEVGQVMNPEHSDYCNCECPQGLSYGKLEETLNRVRMLHAPTTRDGDTFCTACIDHEADYSLWQTYPCATIRALQGDEA